MFTDFISIAKNELIESFPFGVILLRPDRSILWMNQFASEKLYCQPEAILGANWSRVFPHVLVDEIMTGAAGVFPFIFGENHFIAHISKLGRDNDGLLFVFQDIRVFEDLVKEFAPYKHLDADLQAIFDNSYDVIYVSDGEGVTLRVSSACEKLWGYKESELIGKNIYELEKEEVFSPSITRLVMEKKEKVSMTQTTKTGRRLMVMGVPIKDEKGKIIRIVNASRDITEVSQLKTELSKMKQLTEGYRQELTNFRIKNDLENQFIYRSEKMRNVMLLAQKMSKVDSTVLISGESGVGKEQLALFIHRWSERKSGPFICINCGALPESVLDSELFGCQKSGGTKYDGHYGSLVLANGGTLFLDDINQLPLSLQGKLLRTIQEKHTPRFDNDVSETGSIRIIASTSADLQDKVREGTFRKDLYYLLHVVPMVIPPLRDRPDDIIPLILHFASHINKKYGINKRFNPRVLKMLRAYEWPGNVRELQNTVERLLVTVDGEWIEVEHIPDYMHADDSGQRVVQVNRIVPLKEAISLLEKELLALVQEKYGSTTKMAKVLGINQSTVSRKLQQYNKSKLM